MSGATGSLVVWSLAVGTQLVQRVYTAHIVASLDCFPSGLLPNFLDGGLPFST